jgi:hypothetical protein
MAYSTGTLTRRPTMAEIPKEEQRLILEGELRRLKQAEYLLTVRGRVAEKLGDKKRIESVASGLENTIKEIDFIEEELKKCPVESSEPK